MKNVAREESKQEHKSDKWYVFLPRSFILGIIKNYNVDTLSHFFLVNNRTWCKYVYINAG